MVVNVPIYCIYIRLVLLVVCAHDVAFLLRSGEVHPYCKPRICKGQCFEVRQCSTLFPPPPALFFFLSLSQDLRVFHLIKITFWQKQHIGGTDSGQFEYEKASSFKQMLGNFSMRRPVPLNRSWIKYEKASPFKQMLGNLTMGRPVPLNRCWAI